MKQEKNISSVFKAFLKIENGYKGGKTIALGAGINKGYKLSSNENPLGPCPAAVLAIKKSLDKLHIYPDATDIRLREALVAYYENRLYVDEFICADSGSEIIDLIIKGFIREGDEVIVSSPCFVPYQMFSRWAGAKIVDVPLVEESYSLNIEGIIDAINPKTRIVFLTSPNNPTGTYIPKKTLETLLHKIPADVIVVFDEVYWHFADAQDYTQALPYISQYKNIIAVNSFSKTYGLAALRVGYAYMDVEVATYLRQLCKPFLISLPALEGAIAALKDKKFIDRTIATISEERTFMEGKFKEMNIQYYPSQANFFLIKPPISSAEFIAFLEQKGISVRPVDNFGAINKVRITIGNREANTALVNAIKKISLFNASIVCVEIT